MKTRRYAVVSALLVIVLCAALVVGATFALFTQDHTKTITITSGSLKATATFDIVRAYSLDDEALDVTEQEDLSQEVKFTSNGTALLNGDSLVLENLAPGDGVVIALIVANTEDSTTSIKYRVNQTGAAGEYFDFALSSDAAGEQPAQIGTWSENALGTNQSVTLYITVELPASAGNDAMNSTDGKVQFVIDIVQGNATQEQLDEYDAAQGG